jgi:hypothetical protein
MKTLSVKLDDSVFQETEQILSKLKRPRDRYINEALLYYNRLQRKKLSAKKIESESRLVRAESLKVLAEFKNLDDYEDQII